MQITNQILWWRIQWEKSFSGTFKINTGENKESSVRFWSICSSWFLNVYAKWSQKSKGNVLYNQFTISKYLTLICFLLPKFHLNIFPKYFMNRLKDELDILEWYEEEKEGEVPYSSLDTAFFIIFHSFILLLLYYLLISVI